MSKSQFAFFTTFHGVWLIGISILCLIGIVILKRTKGQMRHNFGVILCLSLTFIDVATVMFGYARFIMHPNVVEIEEPDITTIGTPGKMGEYANTLLYLQTVKDAGIDVAKLPTFALVRHLTDVLDPERSQIGQIEIVKQTYNSLELKVHATRQGVVFWRDAYFRYWWAMVNQQYLPIIPAFGAWKAVVIPQGESIVDFQFFPGIIAASFLLAYVLLVFNTGFWFLKRHDSH